VSPPVAVPIMTSARSTSAVSITARKSPSPTISFAMSRRSSPTVSVVTSKTSSSTVSVTTYESPSDSVEDQGALEYSNGKAALHHVLSEVLTQPWWLLAEALERSGFDEIQDVLLMNQAERDMLTFLNGNGVVTPLPQAEKNKLLDVKLFSAYREQIGRPIVDWTKVIKADFNSVTLYMEEEKVTIPRHTAGSHAYTIEPRNVASNATITARRAIAAKPRSVTCTAMVTLPPTIDFISASPDTKVTDDPEIKDVDSPLVNQSPPKSIYRSANA